MEETKEKDAFDLKIKAVDAKVKIKVIKEVRVITGLGLKEVRCILVFIVIYNFRLIILLSKLLGKRACRKGARPDKTWFEER